MRVDYAFLCDAATEYGGKVNALGIGIDRLGVSTLPATHPRLTLVARLVFEDASGASLPFLGPIVDADGREVLPPVEGRFQARENGRRLSRERVIAAESPQRVAREKRVGAKMNDLRLGSRLGPGGEPRDGATQHGHGGRPL